jgi:hypothetical protein
MLDVSATGIFKRAATWAMTPTFRVSSSCVIEPIQLHVPTW